MKNQRSLGERSQVNGQLRKTLDPRPLRDWFVKSRQRELGSRIFHEPARLQQEMLYQIR